MRELSVYVLGIAAFVEDFRRALAVNALLPSFVEIEKRYVIVPAHLPYLRLPVDYILDPEPYKIRQNWNTTAAPGVFSKDVEPTFIEFLHFHEVVLPTIITTTPALDDRPISDKRVPIFDQKEGEPPPDHTSVLWLTPMKKFTSAHGIDPRYVVQDPDDTVAAYVRFPNGKISTAVATPFKLTAVSAVSGAPQGQLDQAVAQLMVCKMDVPDEEFSVHCRDYQNNGKNNFTVRFKAAVPDPWMIFACTSLEDAFQLPLAEDPFDVDTHFSLVYRLSASTKAHEIVLPKAPKGAKPLGGGGCMPPLMSGGATGGQ